TMFVIDVSGSMQGPSIRAARAALLNALERLRPGDQFNMLRFNDRRELFGDAFLDADAPTLDAARRWVRQLEADGGTQILPALELALERCRASDGTRLQRIVFLTDGAVGDEDHVFRAIHTSLGRARLHTIGIGSAPNAHLMRKMAAFGRGYCTFIDDVEASDDPLGRFFTRIDRPVLRDLELTWAGASPAQTFPATLGDLHAGEPLFVSARFEPGRAPAAVVLAGRTADGPLRLESAPPLVAATGSGVALRWARAKIRAAIDALHEGEDPQRVRERVLAVALPFSLLTRYTSLVAVEDVRSAWDRAHPLRLASALPAGTQRFGSTLPRGGTWAGLLQRVGLCLTLAGLGLLLTPTLLRALRERP
ncbi:MAG: VWA domain-containing protein, partial [Acidobacteriota bacterium]